jgi:hypothetical protein
MIRRFLAMALWVAVATTGPTVRSAEDVQQSRGAKILAKLASEPLNWKLPQEGKDYQMVRQPSGVTFYMKSDPSIPLLRMQVCVRAGALFEQGPDVAGMRQRNHDRREDGFAAGLLLR